MWQDEQVLLEMIEKKREFIWGICNWLSAKQIEMSFSEADVDGFLLLH